MKYILFLSLFTILGCSTSYKRVGIIHEYIITAALNKCENHGGLHYITKITDIEEVGLNKDYPCSEYTKFRCNDGSLQNYETEVGYCFISEMQLDDVINNKDVSDEYR